MKTMSIEGIKSRSAVHTQAIASLSLSSDGRVIADELCERVEQLIDDCLVVKAEYDDDVALDEFYSGLVAAYRRAGWGRMGWRDKLAMMSTASLDDMSSRRAIVASVKIARL